MMELLSRYGLSQQILDESTDYLLYMAERTGTLWENDGAYASYNHGFASHIVHVLYRDILDVSKLDIQNRKIQLKFNQINIVWCEGSLPLGDGMMFLKWWVEEGNIFFHIDVPEGYSYEIENLSKMKLIKSELYKKMPLEH